MARIDLSARREGDDYYIVRVSPDEYVAKHQEDIQANDVAVAPLPLYGPIGRIRGWLLARPRLLTGWEPQEPNTWLPFRHAPAAVWIECDNAFDAMREND
jgi:hypothetical protein